MVIVQGVFRLDPSDVAAFLEGRKAGMAGSRAEAGCLEYAFGVDPLDPGRVILSERWASRADLDAHLAAQRSAPPPAQPGPAMISSEVNFFDGAEPFTP
jgi:quinol monooxygenase YgiN